VKQFSFTETSLAAVDGRGPGQRPRVRKIPNSSVSVKNCALSWISS
jgi:hypothetical protein